MMIEIPALLDADELLAVVQVEVAVPEHVWLRHRDLLASADGDRPRPPAQRLVGDRRRVQGLLQRSLQRR